MFFFLFPVRIHIRMFFFSFFLIFLFPQAMRELHGKEISGSHIQVALAKPPFDKKKKEDMLRARERRMMQTMQGRSGWVGFFAQIKESESFWFTFLKSINLYLL